jgi:hypothetical protein
MWNYLTLTIRPLARFCVLPVLVGTAVAAVGWDWQADSSAFLENLQQTEGRIRGEQPATGGKTKLEIEFTDIEGVPYKHSFEVTESEAAQLRVIGKVSLVFDRRDPRRAELGNVVRANFEMWFDWAVLTGGILMICGGFGYLANRTSQILGVQRLFRSGQLVQTEVRDSTLAPGGQTGRFTFAFRGPNGRWFEGKSPDLSARQLAEWPAGRPLLAAYDPGDPRRNEADIFGLAEARRRELPQSA